MKHNIFRNIESDERIGRVLSYRTHIKDWQQFTRTHFNLIAKTINKGVSEKVAKNPVLVTEFLLMGKDKVEKLLDDYGLESVEEITGYLNLSGNTPVHWISGKTLERYWKEEKVHPKDLKMNVLLTYLNVPIQDWEVWKYEANPVPVVKKESETAEPAPLKPVKTNAGDYPLFFENIRKYYLGSYYLYYPKTDNSGYIVKTPFIIKCEGGEVIIESKSEGQRYRSTVVKKMQNNLFVSCANLDWDEDEIYLFNTGLETNPEVIYGVSITLTGKSSIPVAIKNVLIRQSNDISALEGETEKEVPLTGTDHNEEERMVAAYFNKLAGTPLLFAEYRHTLKEFKAYAEGE